MEKQAETGKGKPIEKTGRTDLWELETQLHREGLQLICGVDEAGRGPLAGPVCAAAVIIPQGFLPDGLNDSKKLSEKRFEEIKQATIQGGSNIIKLRGRSSFQSPAYNAVKMIEAAMGGKKFTWPAGTYVNDDKFQHVMMAMPTVMDENGVSYKEPKGTVAEMKALQASYEHLCKMRDEIITLGIIPAIDDWKKVNPNLK